MTESDHIEALKNQFLYLDIDYTQDYGQRVPGQPPNLERPQNQTKKYIFSWPEKAFNDIAFQSKLFLGETRTPATEVLEVVRVRDQCFANYPLLREAMLAA